jgi:hypothetical protein
MSGSIEKITFLTWSSKGLKEKLINKISLKKYFLSLDTYFVRDRTGLNLSDFEIGFGIGEKNAFLRCIKTKNFIHSSAESEGCLRHT